MATCRDLSTESLRSARTLREQGLLRGALSRAYYSAYSELSRALTEALGLLERIP